MHPLKIYLSHIPFQERAVNLKIKKRTSVMFSDKKKERKKLKVPHFAKTQSRRLLLFHFDRIQVQENVSKGKKRKGTLVTFPN
jgi:hypothetical protein